MISLQSIQALHESFRNGSCTPQQVLAQIYSAIESEPKHPVWIEVVPRDAALAQLNAAPQGPLYGIPFAVKDNMDVAGMPTTAACPAFRYVPEQSATVAELLQAAGAILIGKTNMDQFATGLVGTRTPFGACSSVFNEEYVSGGSSSGSAVAVAKNLVTFSLGTDTAGSGRVPAAFNNLVGCKPTRGLVSTTGVVPACRSLDCVSIFAHSCQVAASVLQIVEKYDARDPFSRIGSFLVSSGKSGTRVGVPRRGQLKFFDADYESLFEQTAAKSRELGWQLVEFDLQPFLAAAKLLYEGPYVAERYASVGAFVEANFEQVDPTVGEIIRKAARYSAAEAFAGSYQLEALKKSTAAVWLEVDALILPTVPARYKLIEVDREPVRLNSILGTYTNFVNLLDMSALAIPAGFTADRFPFGVTLIGPAWADRRLLRLGAELSGESMQFLPRPNTIQVAVVGAHLSGQPLNWQLLERDATLVRSTRTSADYRLFALNDTQPPKPGLIRSPGFSGPGIEVEIWEMPVQHFGSFVEAIPAPLGIGTCHLADGSQVKSFLCESSAVTQASEITHLGGWRAYLAQSPGLRR